jgi:DNA-binding transcriptional LysR family regulator
VVGIDVVTGTTRDDLWPPGLGPAGIRQVRGVDEWLTRVAAGHAVGVTSDATVRQHHQPGVVHRRVADAPPLQVLLAWWRDDPPPGLAALRALVVAAYAGEGETAGTDGSG